MLPASVEHGQGESALPMPPMQPGWAGVTGGLRASCKEAVQEVEEVLAVGHSIVIEIRVAREEGCDEVEEVLRVQPPVVVPVARARGDRPDAHLARAHRASEAVQADDVLLADQ